MGSRTRSKDCDVILGGFNYGSDSDEDSQSADDGSDSETWSEFGDRLLDLPPAEDPDVKLDVIPSIDDDFDGQNEPEFDVGRSKGQKVESNSLSYLNIDLKSISTRVTNERLKEIQNINSRFWQPIVYLSKLSIMNQDTTPFISFKDEGNNQNTVTRRRRKKGGRKDYRRIEKLRRANETPEQRNKRLTRVREYNAKKRIEETEEERNSRLAQARELKARKRNEDKKRKDKSQKVNGELSRQFVKNSSKTLKMSGQSQKYEKISNSYPAGSKLSTREKARLDTARRRANETEEQRNKRLSRGREYMTRRRENETEEERKRRIVKAVDCVSKKRWENRRKFEQYSSQNPEIDVFCELCQRPFTSPFRLNRHNKYYHPEIYKNPAYICEQCGRSFKLQIQLDNHKLFIHNPESIRKVAQKIGQNISTTTPTAYLCEACGKGYVGLEGYTSHIERHGKILAMRKEAHEKTVRFENPTKSDEEIQEILSNFWNSEESSKLISRPESKQETKVLAREIKIEKITKKGLQNPGETVDQCLDRLNAERLDKMKKAREAETEEEKATRRERYRINFNLWITRNKEKYDNYVNSYCSNPINKKKRLLEKNSEKHKKRQAYQKAKWASLAPEKKAQRLEYMKNYAKNKSKN